MPGPCLVLGTPFPVRIACRPVEMSCLYYQFIELPYYSDLMLFAFEGDVSPNTENGSNIHISVFFQDGLLQQYKITYHIYL